MATSNYIWALKIAFAAQLAAWVFLLILFPFYVKSTYSEYNWGAEHKGAWATFKWVATHALPLLAAHTFFVVDTPFSLLSRFRVSKKLLLVLLVVVVAAGAKIDLGYSGPHVLAYPAVVAVMVFLAARACSRLSLGYAAAVLVLTMIAADLYEAPVVYATFLDRLKYYVKFWLYGVLLPYVLLLGYIRPRTSKTSVAAAFAILLAAWIVLPLPGLLRAPYTVGAVVTGIAKIATGAALGLLHEPGGGNPVFLVISRTILSRPSAHQQSRLS